MPHDRLAAGGRVCLAAQLHNRRRAHEESSPGREGDIFAISHSGNSTEPLSLSPSGWTALLIAHFASLKLLASKFPCLLLYLVFTLAK